MPGEQDGEAARRQEVTSGGDAYVAGRDLNVYLGGGYERLDDALQYSGGLLDRLDLPRFTGRGGLLAAVEEFLRGHDRGYFVLEGDAGLGKTAFCAWLVAATTIRCILWSFSTAVIPGPR